MPTEPGGPPRRASLRAAKARDNEPFRDGAGPDGGRFFLPWAMLRERFRARGIELNTPDLNAGHAVAFELHLNAQRRVPRDVPCYAYLYEDPLVRPLNADRARLRRYRRVFTWNDELADGDRLVRLPYPNEIRPHDDDVERDLQVVLIASNKALLHADPRNLHERRVAVIRAFERDAPAAFHLYGRGWERPAVRPGRWGRLLKRLQQWRARWRGTPAEPPFPSWRGEIDQPKDAVLRRARFAIAFENTRGSPGYVTEKIFDCFRCGCIPVYIGPPNAAALIPPDCWIDGDRFDDPAALVRHLLALDERAQQRYRDAMRRFLRSPAAQAYSNEHFCDTLVRVIGADLGLPG